MIPNPIRKVLSSIHKHRVRALLMGGQACVFYGAAEFSRDTDFAIFSSAPNLQRLRRALAELDAKVIAVPPFETKYLRKGHAIHFRCHHPEASGLRIDVMARMRGVDSFANLWRRRTTVALPDGTQCNLMSIADLVQAKKTQRDKDWPMLRRLLEAHYFENRERPRRAQIDFWLRELRTAEMLREVVQRYPAAARRVSARRPLLRRAIHGSESDLDTELRAEELNEREQDRIYWEPLKKDLERLRHARISEWRSGSRQAPQ